MSMKFCHHCGKAVPTGTKYCPYCGYLVDNLSKINNKRQSKTVQSRYYQQPNKNKNPVKILLIIAGMIILLISGGFGIHAYNQHEYYATNYVNLNDNGGKYGYYSDVSQKKFWYKPHYVIVKKNIRAYDIADKGTDTADNYSIGSKVLKKGSVVKAAYTPTTPGGFAIHGKGFHDSTSDESAWIINPASMDSKTMPTYKKSNSNYWIKAVRKY